MKLIDINPPQELQSKILGRISLREHRIARTKKAVMGIFSVSSLTGLVLAIRFTLDELSQSGLFHYLSLAFSDSGAMVTLWQEFALSLVDSIPIMGMILTLGSVAIFLGSIRFIFTSELKTKHIYGY